MNRWVRFVAVALGSVVISGCCCSLFGRRGEIKMIESNDTEYADLLRLKAETTIVQTPVPWEAQTSTGPVTHWLVKRGESLWSISRELWGQGVYWRSLASANGLKDPRFLRAGQSLVVPKEITDQDKLSALQAPLSLASPTPTPSHSEAEYSYAHLLGRPYPRIRRAFNPGEKLSFVVSYLGMDVGKATMEVKGVEDVEGNPCLRIEVTARSIGVFSKLYPVKDRMITWVDIYELFTRKFEKHIHEFRYHLDEVRHYDQSAHVMTWDKVKTLVIPPKVHDMLSAFYFYRCLEALNAEEAVSFWSNSGSKNYELRVDYLGRKRVKTRAGTFDCIIIKPRAVFEGFFVKRGEVIIYLTDDERRIPVKVVGKAPFMGKISVTLVEAQIPDPGPLGLRP